MAKYKFRMIIEDTKGGKMSFIANHPGTTTTGFSDFYFINTDDYKTYSASQALTTIENMMICEYLNGPNFTGSVGDGVIALDQAKFYRHTPANTILSASLVGNEETGSIKLTSKHFTDNTTLKRYKFFGEKVCSVLGFPENIWIYPESVVLSNTGSEESRITGNLQSRALSVTNTFSISNIGNISSDLPFKINKESDRWIKWVNVTASYLDNLVYDNNLLMGFNAETNGYELKHNHEPIGDDDRDVVKFDISASSIQIGDLNTYGNGYNAVKVTGNEPRIIFDDNTFANQYFVVGTMENSGHCIGWYSADDFHLGTISTKNDTTLYKYFSIKGSDGKVVLGGPGAKSSAITGNLTVTGSGAVYLDLNSLGAGYVSSLRFNDTGGTRNVASIATGPGTTFAIKDEIADDNLIYVGSLGSTTGMEIFGDATDKTIVMGDGLPAQSNVKLIVNGNVSASEGLFVSQSVRLKSKVIHKSNTEGPEFLFHWGGRSASFDHDNNYTWKKVADINCGTGTYQGASGWANITNHGSNFGNSSDTKEFPFYWSIYYTGGGSDGDQNTASVKGFQVHNLSQDIFRVVQVNSSGDYELQVHQVGISWRDMTIRAGVYSMGGNTSITWLDPPINATNAQTVYYGTPAATQYFQEGYFGGNVRIGSGSRSDTNLSIYKADDNVSDHLKFFLGSTRMGEIGAEDATWLRINQETNKKIYTPRFFRADDGASLGTSATAQNYVGGLTVGVSAAGDSGTGRDGVPIARFHRGTSANFIDIYGDSAANYIQSGDSGDNQKQLVIAAQASSTATKTIQFQIGQTDGTYDEKLRVDNAGIDVTGDMVVEDSSGNTKLKVTSDGLDPFSIYCDGGSAGANNEDAITILADHENTCSIAFVDDDAVGSQDFRISYNASAERLTFDKDDMNDVLSLAGDSNGPHVGIGVKAPTGYGNTFRVEGTAGSGTPIAWIRHKGTTDGNNNDVLTLQTMVADGAADSSERFLNFVDAGANYIGKVRGNGSNVQYITSFTGQHASVMASGSYEAGMIVESTGEVWGKTDDGAHLDTGLPKVQITTTSSSKKVYGVLAELDASETYEGCIAAFGVLDDETPVTINSIGEGLMVITNINGNVENGDYIVSSDIAGYGQKQDDDLLRSSTVAKCTETIDWGNVTDTITHNGVQYKKYTTTCTYHCG